MTNGRGDGMRLHKRVSVCCFLVLASLLSVGSRPAWAQDPIHKAGRGVVNILTGWLEVPKHFSLGKEEENPFLGMAWGVVKGTGLGLTRMVVGAYETVTFLIPYPHEYASPYEAMELPDYAWQ